jgi:hypothetical protein
MSSAASGERTSVTWRHVQLLHLPRYPPLHTTAQPHFEPGTAGVGEARNVIRELRSWNHCAKAAVNYEYEKIKWESRDCIAQILNTIRVHSWCNTAWCVEVLWHQVWNAATLLFKVPAKQNLALFVIKHCDDAATARTSSQIFSIQETKRRVAKVCIWNE